MEKSCGNSCKDCEEWMKHFYQSHLDELNVSSQMQSNRAKTTVGHPYYSCKSLRLTSSQEKKLTKLALALLPNLSFASLMYQSYVGIKRCRLRIRTPAVKKQPNDPSDSKQERDVDVFVQLQ